MEFRKDAAVRNGWDPFKHDSQENNSQMLMRWLSVHGEQRGMLLSLSEKRIPIDRTALPRSTDQYPQIKNHPISFELVESYIGIVLNV
jgi:hypothetical protein